MSDPVPSTSLQLQSEIRSDATLVVSLAEVPVPEPREDEVLVRVEASPINPSDLGWMFGPADMTTVKQSGSAERPVVTADVPERFLGALAGRVDRPLPVGNEGAGVVLAAGASEAAQALLGRVVAASPGGMYSQYRRVKADLCLPLPEGTTPVEGASCFVNPLTVLGMVETMRIEGHTALVHTAAASNLGQMLVKLCIEEGIELVNVVRKPEQVALLRGIGARHVCNSSEESFRDDLTAALVETGATLAFDATGGGRLASRILACMETAASRRSAPKEYSRYGSTTYKQVYIYGALDPSPTQLDRNFGTAWGIGGWLLMPFLDRIGPERANELRQRVAEGIKTTFASSYTEEVSLAGALQLDAIAVYGRRATGEKYLIRPNAGSS